jgi:hypothetical protein
MQSSAPALDVLEYHQVMFKGDFLAPSIYRGEPRKELEEAWHRISNNGLRRIRLPKEDLYRLNKTASKDVVGFLGEDDEDIHDAEGLLEVFHQLHCLVSDLDLAPRVFAIDVCRMNSEERLGRATI